MCDPDAQRPPVLAARSELVDEVAHRLLVSAHALERNHLALDRHDRLHVEQVACPGARAADAAAATEELERVHREEQMRVALVPFEQALDLLVRRPAIEAALDCEAEHRDRR